MTRLEPPKCLNCTHWAAYPGPGSPDKPWEYPPEALRKGECGLTQAEQPESTIRIQFYRQTEDSGTVFGPVDNPPDYRCVLVTPGDFSCSEHDYDAEEDE